MRKPFKGLTPRHRAAMADLMAGGGAAVFMGQHSGRVMRALRRRGIARPLTNRGSKWYVWVGEGVTFSGS